MERRTVQPPHPPHTTESFAFMICEVGDARRPVRFAASQAWGNLWAFYVED